MPKKEKKLERHVWLDVIITLLTLELMAYFYYGIHVAFLGFLCIVISLFTEFVCLRLMHREFTADDLSCTSDALIIALMLPASMEYKIAGLACIFAVTIAKNVFGGRLNMIFSPPAVAYIFMYTSWKSQLLMFPQPHTQQGIFEKAETLVNSASHVFNTTGKFDYTNFEILMGNFSGSSGSVSILILIISAFMLIMRKDISTGAFFGTVFGTVFLAYLVPITNSISDSVKYSLVTNMTLFTALYIVADIRIAPKSFINAFFYGLIIGASAYIITLTTAKENAIVLISVLFTPVALLFKNIEKKIELAETPEKAVTADE